MKQSLRARRMERAHRRSKNQGKLSLVSLMDIFTILVFFLLVNSADVEVLQTHKSIKLPESTATQEPGNTLVVTVNSQSVLVDGRKVADTPAVLASEGDYIDELRAELEYRAARKPVSEAEREMGREATIMGHREISYKLLKKIMSTMAETEYRNISLAVNRLASDSMPADTTVEMDPASAAED